MIFPVWCQHSRVAQWAHVLSSRNPLLRVWHAATAAIARVRLYMLRNGQVIETFLAFDAV